MCLAFPGKIVKIEKDIATIDYQSEQRTAKILNSEYQVGDYIIAQMGIVVQRLSKEQALNALGIYSGNIS